MPQFSISKIQSPEGELTQKPKSKTTSLFRLEEKLKHRQMLIFFLIHCQANNINIRQSLVKFAYLR